MTEGSTQIVTQHDRFAKVKHINGLAALRASNAIPMTPTARLLFEWVCLNAKCHGCAWTNWGFAKWADKWGVTVRTVRRARAELEAKGILRHETRERYGVLPNGDRARNRTQVLFPIVPGQKLDRIRSGPDRTSSVRSDRPRDSFSSLDQKGGYNKLGYALPDAEAVPAHIGASARAIFERWRVLHEPNLVQSDDSMGWFIEMTLIIQGWLIQGMDAQTCLWAVEGARYSAFNKAPSMRSIRFIFGSKARILALSDEGRRFSYRLAKPTLTQERNAACSVDENRARAQMLLASLQPPPVKEDLDHADFAESAE